MKQVCPRIIFFQVFASLCLQFSLFSFWELHQSDLSNKHLSLRAPAHMVFCFICNICMLHVGMAFRERYGVARDRCHHLFLFLLHFHWKRLASHPSWVAVCRTTGMPKPHLSEGKWSRAEFDIYDNIHPNLCISKWSTGINHQKQKLLNFIHTWVASLHHYCQCFAMSWAVNKKQRGRDQADFCLVGNTVMVSVDSHWRNIKDKNPGCALNRVEASPLSPSLGSCFPPQGWTWPCWEERPHQDLWKQSQGLQLTLCSFHSVINS